LLIINIILIILLKECY